MDPMVGSAGVDNTDGDIVSDSSDNADLLDFCFLCSRQFFHANLDNYGTERLKEEDVLEIFFEELGPVDHALLQCCPSCNALCKTLLRTKEALSSLLDEITRLLLRSRKDSFLLSKSSVVGRLFQYSNTPLPPCETSSYLQQPLSQINFQKEGSSNIIPGVNNPSDSFPTQFDLRLDSCNISVGDLDLGLTSTHSTGTPISVIKRSPLASSKLKRGKDDGDVLPSGELPPTSSAPSFSSIYTESIMNSVSDNACDISEGVIRHHHRHTETKVSKILPPAIPPTPIKDVSTSPKIGCNPNETNKSVIISFENEPSKQPEVPLIVEVDPVDANSQNKISTEPRISGNETEEKSENPQTQPSTSNESNHSTDKKVTKFQCLPCNKCFKSARNLRNHLAAHNQERKFICEICGVSYRHKAGLEAHVSIHNGESKFQCKICDKAFTQKSGLERHLRIHSGKFQFQCHTCGKQFLHHSSFSAHKLTHEGVKELKCPYCPSLFFFQKSHLSRHIRIHTGEKRYKCEQCERSFSERYNLQVHLKTHEDDPKHLFKCDKCFKSFTRKFKLKQHVNKVH